MPNIIDYLAWRGDVPFSCVPFNDVDNLILTQFCYLPLERAEVPCDGRSVRDIAALLEEHPDTFGFIDAQGNRDMVRLMSSGDRFGEIQVQGYCSETDEEKELQFAGMTFLLPDGTVYVAFRGTDNTLVGWKEDFNMAFSCPVPAQTEALGYLQAVCETASGPVRVGGHSKGGNLAVYASAYLPGSLRDRVLQVYSNDGPGMCDEVINSPGYQQIAGRIVSILPEFSIIGMLLYEHRGYKVIASNASGLMQHSAFTWQVQSRGFVELPGLKRTSLKIDEVLDTWLFEMQEDERMELVEALYTALKRAELKTVEGLLAHRMKTAVSILSAVRHFDHETRHLVWEKLTRLAGMALKGDTAGQE
jgi:hypothetical protein